MKKINGETPRQKQMRRREMVKDIIIAAIVTSIMPMMIIHWVIFGYIH